MKVVIFFFFQAEDGIRDAQVSRGLGDVYKRQHSDLGSVGDSDSRLGSDVADDVFQSGWGDQRYSEKTGFDHRLCEFSRRQYDDGFLVDGHRRCLENHPVYGASAFGGPTDDPFATV